MSSKTFSDLMSCNQLFRDLKVEKATGMPASTHSLLGSVSIKQSVFGGGNSNQSTPRASHDPNTRSTFLKVERKKKQAEKKANQIADDMMKQLNDEIEVPPGRLNRDEVLSPITEELRHKEESKVQLN